MPYIPHTRVDTKTMLESIGVDAIDDLFIEIPAELRSDKLANIPAGINELAAIQEAELFGAKNNNGICFIGAGSYDHHIPAVVWDIAGRGEFLTSYTPYQAEASQGSLQLLYEYQTMIAELTGMEVANASLYDGATALAEAVLMAIRINKVTNNRTVLVPETLHPFYRQVLQTICCNQQIKFISLPLNMESGCSDLSALAQYNKNDIAALIIVQPNFFGCLESVDELTDWATKNDVISIACVNPLSLALLKPPGLWGKTGVAIVCGEGQPLGCPIASGGPYFGFFSTRKEYVRQMPGRLAGRTIDQEQRTGFTLTLQAREQHIRRAKATSNICTNQGLLVTAAAIYMSLLGAQGMAQVAKAAHINTSLLLKALTQVDGVSSVFAGDFFHEVLIKLSKPLDQVLSQLQEAGIAGGYSIEKHYPQLGNSLLICATEKRTLNEIDHYKKILTQVMVN